MRKDDFRRGSQALFLAVVAASPLCTTAAIAEQSPPSVTSQGLHASIVGGEKVVDREDPVYRHSSRLLIQGELQAGDQVPDEVVGKTVSWRCSATIVNETTLLTAAHCMPEQLALRDTRGQIYRAPVSIRTIEAFFGLSPREDAFWGQDASHYVRHPEYRDNWFERVSNPWNPTTPVHDIALVFLEESIPSGKSPAALAGSTDTLERTKLTLAGYGRAVLSNPVEVPELRKVTVPFLESLRNQSDFFAGFGDPNRPRRVPGPKGACSGDSGGPAFRAPAPSSPKDFGEDVDHDSESEAGAERNGAIPGEEPPLVLTGVVVRGPGEDGGGCESSLTILTDVRPYGDWIRSLTKINQGHP